MSPSQGRNRVNGKIEVDADDNIRALDAAHGYALFRYAYRRLTDHREAEEAVQEVLVRAWRYSSSYDSERGSVRMWLFGIARNVVADRMSKQHLHLVDSAPDHAAVDESIDQIVDTSMVEDALARLTPEHRDAIVAAYYHGKTTTQIAVESGIAPGTIKSRIFYGLRALRDTLEEQGIIQ